MGKKNDANSFGFTDEEIRAKAAEIWKARSSEDLTSQDDWNKAIEVLKEEKDPYRKIKKWWKWTGLREKTLWDIILSLVLPLAVIPAGFVLQDFIKQKEQQATNDKIKQEQQFADNKDKKETLDKYLEGMEKLIQKGLLKNRQDSDLFIIAQAKTVVALQSLNPTRQHLVIQFLEGAKLNSLSSGKGLLFKSRMSKAVFIEADLTGANLTEANLEEANLAQAKLGKSELISANLEKAKLFSANLEKANLTGANLVDADMGAANLERTDLTRANLKGTDLRGAKFSGANLTEADLTRANLEGTDLRGARLDSVNFLATDLTKTKLEEQQLSLCLLCKVVLPPKSLVNPNRDCDTITQLLLKRYPERFKTLAEAKTYVNDQSLPR